MAAILKMEKMQGIVPRAFIQIQTNEECKAHRRLEGQKRQTVRANLLVGYLTGARDAVAVSHTVSQASPIIAHCHRGSSLGF